MLSALVAIVSLAVLLAYFLHRARSLNRSFTRAYREALASSSEPRARLELPAGRYEPEDEAPRWAVATLVGTNKAARWGVPVYVTYTGDALMVTVLEDGTLFPGTAPTEVRVHEVLEARVAG